MPCTGRLCVPGANDCGELVVLLARDGAYEGGTVAEEGEYRSWRGAPSVAEFGRYVFRGAGLPLEPAAELVVGRRRFFGWKEGGVLTVRISPVRLCWSLLQLLPRGRKSLLSAFRSGWTRIQLALARTMKEPAPAWLTLPSSESAWAREVESRKSSNFHREPTSR